ncbi:MAG: hypothetical protein FWD56_05410 [Bacteroidales bacterium]|nr:hypothetical protein [Bacteroidales bacterium]
MKTKRIVVLLLVGVLMVACNKVEQKVKPIAIDLPASYKSDTAAYRYITNYAKSLNEFGKKVAKMHHEGEKWHKKEYESLSDRDLYRLVKLDYDYAELWLKQGVRNHAMLVEAGDVLKRVTEQGAAKIAESQVVFAHYYRDLLLAYGVDLKLDKSPYVPTPEEDSIRAARIDSLTRIERERLSLERAIMEAEHRRQMDSIRNDLNR